MGTSFKHGVVTFDLILFALSQLIVESLKSFWSLVTGESWSIEDLNKFLESLNFLVNVIDLMNNSDILWLKNTNLLLKDLNLLNDGNFLMSQVNNSLSNVLRFSNNLLDILLGDWFRNWLGNSSDSSLNVNNLLN